MLVAALQVVTREVVRGRYFAGMRFLWVLVAIILLLTVAMLIKRLMK